jgi:hypothetical protein
VAVAVGVALGTAVAVLVAAANVAVCVGAEVPLGFAIAVRRDEHGRRGRPRLRVVVVPARGEQTDE